MELTLGSLLKAPTDGISGPLIMPPSVPGLEGLVGPMQQLAMHFLSNVAKPQHKQGKAAHTHTQHFICTVTLPQCDNVLCFTPQRTQLLS